MAALRRGSLSPSLNSSLHQIPRCFSSAFSTVDAPPAADEEGSRPAQDDDLRSRLFRLRFPKRSAMASIERWVSEGRHVSASELRRIARDLKRAQRYKHALEGQIGNCKPWRASSEGQHISWGSMGFVLRPTSLLRAWILSSTRCFHATRLLSGRNYYEILGVSKDATQDDVKKAFHALAKEYHPDVNKNNPTAKRKFQEIRDAYETLRDPAKRADYDRDFSNGVEKERHASDDAKGFRYAHERYATDNAEGFPNMHQDPFSDTFYKIFSEVFEHDMEVFAPDIEVELNLTFSEAAKGCRKHLSFSAQVLCDSCYGRGHPVDAKPSKCLHCNGLGRVTVFPFTSTCRTCKGLGKIMKEHCRVCRGSGLVEGVKNIEVTIPAGVDSGDTVKVPKAGNSGGQGVHPGSLHIKLQVAKDPVFVRDGADIYVDSHISFTQAILGGNIEVPTLFGKTQVKIPKGVQPGQLLVLRGRGLPKKIGLVDHGDQYVRFRVNFPTQVNDRQRTLLEDFAKEEAMQESSGFADGKWLDQQLCTG